MNNCEHFSIRRAVAGFRDRDWMRNYPFHINREPTPEEKSLLLPPLDTPMFQWWCCRNCVRNITGSTSDSHKMDNMLDGNSEILYLDQFPSTMMNFAASVVPDAEVGQTNITASGHNVETGLQVSVNRTVTFDLNKPPLPELCEEPALGAIGITDDDRNRNCHNKECALVDEINKRNDDVGGGSPIAGADETTGRSAEAVGALPIVRDSPSAHDDHPSSERTETDECSDGVDYLGMEDDWASVPKRPKRYRFVDDLMNADGPMMSGNVPSRGNLNTASTSGPQDLDQVQPPLVGLPLDKSLPLSKGKCQTAQPNKTGNLVVPRKRRIFGNEVLSTGDVNGKVDPVQLDGGPWKRVGRPVDDKAYKQNPVVHQEKSPLTQSKEAASKEQRNSDNKQKPKKFKRDARVRASEAPMDTSAGRSSQLQQHREGFMSGIHLLSLVAAETGDSSASQETQYSGALVPLHGIPEDDLYPLDTVAPLNSGVLALGYTVCTELKAPHDFLLVADDIEQFQLNPDHIILREPKERPAAREQLKHNCDILSSCCQSTIFSADPSGHCHDLDPVHSTREMASIHSR